MRNAAAEFGGLFVVSEDPGTDPPTLDESTHVRVLADEPVEDMGATQELDLSDELDLLSHSDLWTLPLHALDDSYGLRSEVATIADIELKLDSALCSRLEFSAS